MKISGDRFGLRGGKACGCGGRSRAAHHAWLLLCVAAASGVVQAGDCTVSTSPVLFGSYDPLAATPVEMNGSVRVNCDTTTVGEFFLGVSVTIALGTGGSSSYASRTMAQGALLPRLHYNLYTTSARNTVWGNGTSGTQAVGGTLGGLFTGQPSERSFPVHGRIPAGQDPAVGLHSDTIIVTVTF